MLKLPTLKRKKPIVYISLGIYLLLAAFIIVESCLSSGLSGLQSEFFALFSSSVVNTISGPVIPNEIKPTSFIETEDTSYLGKNNNNEALIALGTTTRVTFVCRRRQHRLCGFWHGKAPSLVVPRGKMDTRCRGGFPNRLPFRLPSIWT